MRRLIILTPAFVLVAACGSGPTKQEQNLQETPAGAPTERGSETGGDLAPSQ